MKSAMRPICRFVAQLSGLKVEGAITQSRSGEAERREKRRVSQKTPLPCNEIPFRCPPLAWFNSSPV